MEDRHMSLHEKEFRSMKHLGRMQKRDHVSDR